MSELCPPPPGASPSAERPVYEPQRGPLRAEGPGPRAGSVRSPLPARGSTHDDAIYPGCPQRSTSGTEGSHLVPMAGPTGRLTTCYFVKPYPPVAATSSRPARASSRPRWRTATCQPLAPAASALKPPANCSLESLGPTTPDWYGHSSQQPPPTTISAGSLNQPRTGTPALFLRLEGHTFLSPDVDLTLSAFGVERWVIAAVGPPRWLAPRAPLQPCSVP